MPASRSSSTTRYSSSTVPGGSSRTRSRSGAIDIERAQRARQLVLARPRHAGGLAVRAQPRVLEVRAPALERREPAQEADLVGVGRGVEVAAQDLGRVVVAAPERADRGVDRADLLLARDAVVEAVVEVCGVDPDRSALAGLDLRGQEYRASATRGSQRAARASRRSLARSPRAPPRRHPARTVRRPSRPPSRRTRASPGPRRSRGRSCDPCTVAPLASTPRRPRAPGAGGSRGRGGGRAAARFPRSSASRRASRTSLACCCCRCRQRCRAR